MIQDTIDKIEARLQRADSIKEESKAELLKLLATLKTEIASLSQTDADQAQSIAAFAEVYTHETTRLERKPELVEHSLKGLSSSVEGFEQSHPKLVQVVNSICTMLSNIGI